MTAVEPPAKCSEKQIHGVWSPRGSLFTKFLSSVQPSDYFSFSSAPRNQRMINFVNFLEVFLPKFIVNQAGVSLGSLLSSGKSGW